MARYAVVNGGGAVVNVVEWDGQSSWAPPSGQQVIQSDIARIGDTWTGSSFTAPAAPAADPTASDVKSLRDYVTDTGLTSYLGNAAPTNAQTLAVVKGTVLALRALLRVLYRIAS